MSDDRDHILRRRALLLGTALTALRCTPSVQEPAAGPEPSPVATIEAPEDTTPPADDVPPPDTDHRDAPVDIARPPTDIPDGVSEKIRNMYQGLYAGTERVEKQTGQIAALLPTCGVTVSSCESAWVKVAEAHRDHQRNGWTSGCGSGTTPEGKAFDARAALHAKYREQLEMALNKKIDKAVGPDETAKARWTKLKADANAARPVPCLSIACMDY